MENEILQQILSELKDLKQGQTETNSRLDKLEQGQTELDRKVTKIEIAIENDIKPDIKTVAEGHGILNRKLDDLKDIGEKVLRLQDCDTVQNVALRELAMRTASK